MKRVMIIGQPGSGKSTLARALGAKTNLPVHHMDMIHWMPGWIERPKPEKAAMANAIERQEAWILEGNLSATYDHRLGHYDTLIVIDLPLPLRAWRVFKRTLLNRGRSRPDLPSNCPERFDREFWIYIWNTRKSARVRQLRAMSDAGPNVAIHHLQSRRAVQRFLTSV